MPESKIRLMDLGYALNRFRSKLDNPDLQTEDEGSFTLCLMGASSLVEKTIDEIRDGFVAGCDVVHLLVIDEASILRARQVAACLKGEGMVSTEESPSEDIPQSGIVRYLTFTKVS